MFAAHHGVSNDRFKGVTSQAREAPVRTEPHPTRSFALPAPELPASICHFLAPSSSSAVSRWLAQANLPSIAFSIQLSLIPAKRLHPQLRTKDDEKDSEMTPACGPFVPFTIPGGGSKHSDMQKNPSQLGNSRNCGKSRPAFCPANITSRGSNPRSHADKSLKHFLSKRPIAIYLRCPSHQLHIVALPRTSWQVTGPPTTNDNLT
jgi:hypothetical protein